MALILIVDTCNLMINQEQKRDVGCDVREKVWMEWMMFIRWNVTNGIANPSPKLGEEDNHDIEVAHMGNDPYFGVSILEIPSNQSSSSDSIHTIVHPDHQISEHNSKWAKDHPLENIIGKLARPVSIRLQLHEQDMFCYYDAFLTAIEPKTYKDALTQSYWIEAMQEELNEFERLEV
ncbi:hypothetical protein Tco_1033950 [Tanacetum coccineum]